MTPHGSRLTPHDALHGDPQARLRCADLAAGLWVVGAFNYSEVLRATWSLTLTPTPNPLLHP